MLAQKKLVRVTLDIRCYDDLDLDNINWRELLELEGGEDVDVNIKEFDPFWSCARSRSGTRPLDICHVMV